MLATVDGVGSQEMKRDTIKSLAKEISERWPKLVVKVERGYRNTDRKIGRLRWPGKGRYGSRIIVPFQKHLKAMLNDLRDAARCATPVQRIAFRAMGVAADVRKKRGL